MQQMILKFLKRLVVWVLEGLVEGLLLGCFLGAVWLPPGYSGLLPWGVVLAGLAIGVVLFFNGYYLTMALFGLVWRSQRWWLYPTIAATLFILHTYIAFVRFSKLSFTVEGQVTELPFVAGGACIVFACRLLGGWCLRKWSTPRPQNRGVAQSLT